MLVPLGHMRQTGSWCRIESVKCVLTFLPCTSYWRSSRSDVVFTFLLCLRRITQQTSNLQQLDHVSSLRLWFVCWVSAPSADPLSRPRPSLSAHVSHIPKGEDGMCLSSCALFSPFLFILIINKTNVWERRKETGGNTRPCCMWAANLYHVGETSNWQIRVPNRHWRSPRFPSVLMNEEPYERAHSQVPLYKNTTPFFRQTLDLLHCFP